MTYTPLKHIVFITGPSFSHVRPALKLSVRLVEKFPNVFFSVYVFGPLSTQADKYIAGQSQAARERIHISASIVDDLTIKSAGENPIEIILSMERNFGPWIAAQISKSSFEINGQVAGLPSYIMEDHINGGIGLANKEFHGLPVASCWVTSAAPVAANLGTLFGGNDNAPSKQEPGEEQTSDGVSHSGLSNRLVCVPGLPAYYEYEQRPQDFPHIGPLFAAFQKRWKIMGEQTDIILFTSTYEMEPVVAEACAQMFPRPLLVHCVGPVVDLPGSALPGDISQSIGPNTVSPDPVLSFLNRAYTDLGAQSVIYMAFGSLFFPSPQSASHLIIIIKEILAHGFRLVFSMNSDNANAVGLSGEDLEKMVNSGNAIFPEWTKQLEVLEHPALHYFLSHGGWNSAIESIVRGVPMIFWPMSADHPINTLQLTRQHDCGFELLQVRTGLARNVAYRDTGDIPIIGSDEAVGAEIRKVLGMTRGRRGDQQRLNTNALGKVILGSLEKGGSGDRALERFGKAIGL